MVNSTMGKGFKVVAIACAVVLACSTAQILNSTINYTVANAVSVSYTYDVDDNDDGTTTGKVHIDTGNYTTVTVTFTGGVAGATTSGEVGYWDSSANKWVDKVDTWEEEKFDSDGNLSVTVKVPANTKDVQVLLTYYADWSSGSNGKLLDKDSFKTITVESGSGSSSSTNTSNTTKTPSTTTSGASTTGSSVNITYDVDDNDDGTTTGKIHLDTGSYTTVTVTFTGGVPGATTSGAVGYWDSVTDSWKDDVDAWEGEEFDSNGNLTLTLTVPANIDDVQIMLTYYADWSSGEEEVIDKESFTTKNITVTSGSSSSNSSGGSTVKPGVDANQDLPEGCYCNWTDITEGTENTQTKNLVDSSVSSGKKSVTITQGGQWSAYDEGNEPIILDQTWEPEEEGVYDTDHGNDEITNSNNFMFTEDFNLPTDAEIDHFRFTVESDEPMLQVQFGAGISVQKGCEIANSGSTDYLGTATENIWFNESGTYDPEDDDDYAELTNSNGNKYYGFNRGKDVGETNYIQLQWDVYDDVKPYIQNDAWSSVSFQYWYGVDPADWELIDWSAPDHATDIEHKPATVNVTEATCTYNLTQSYNYTDTATKSVDLEVFGDMDGIKFSDLGLTENDKPKAVTFTVSGDSDLGKLVGAFGVSVNDDCPTDKLESDNWYQSANLVYEDCSDTYEITWIIPSDIANYISPEYDAEVKFGCWYAGSGENALDSVKITNVAVDYYTEEATTTTTTSATTTTTTTTTSATTTTTKATTTSKSDSPTTTTTTTTSASAERLWGDANCDGQVKNNDVQLIRQYLLHMDVEISDDGLLNSDVTHDDSIKNNDVQLIRQYLLHIVEYEALEP